MGMTPTERNQLIRLMKNRAKQAEREAETREKILVTEVMEEMTVEYQAQDSLWAEAVRVAQDALEKANAHIRVQCADMGIPPEHAPELQLAWSSRSSQFANRERRADLEKLARTRAATMTKMAKTEIQNATLKIEEQLVLGGLESDEAKAVVTQLPTAENLMPNLSLDDLGVRRWRPDEDAAYQLTAPRTTADRKRRRILRAIESNPGASDRKIAEIASVDHKTVAAHRRDRGTPRSRWGIPHAAGEHSGSP